MSKNKSQIYLKATGQWVPVSEEFHKAYFHEIDLFRRKQIRRGFCKCTGPKWWLCDMDCGVCEFRCANSKYISIDAQVGEGNDACSIANAIPDDSGDVEETLMLAELFAALHEELEKLDPDGRRICELIMEGRTEREIAADMGKRQSTINYKKNKAFSILREALKDYI